MTDAQQEQLREALQHIAELRATMGPLQRAVEGAVATMGAQSADAIALRRELDRMRAALDGPPDADAIRPRLRVLETQQVMNTSGGRPGINLPSADDVAKYGQAFKKWGGKSVLIVAGLILCWRLYACDTEQTVALYERLRKVEARVSDNTATNARQDTVLNAVVPLVDSTGAVVDSLADDEIDTDGDAP